MKIKYPLSIKRKVPRRRVDKVLLMTVVLLVLFGILSVANASVVQGESVFGDKWYFAKQQATWGAIGFAILLIFSQIKYTFWLKVSPYFFFFSIVLLFVVLIPSVGVSALGSRRWLSISGFVFQPSELAKLSTALILAFLASKDKKVRYSLACLGLVALLVVIEPDLGTSLVIVSEGLAILFSYGLSFVFFLPLLGVSLGLAALSILISPYRKDRFLSFVKAIEEPLSSSYHIRQTLFALAGGGLFGVGLGQSRQKYLFLPEATNDSIFAIIAEEAGFVGAAVLVGAFLFLIFRGYKIASRAPDKFAKLFGVGITTWIGTQAILNFSSIVALTPITGIPLPLISYGGSSLVVTLAGLGILLNISKYSDK